MNAEYEWDLFLVHAAADTASAEVLYQLLAPRARVFLDSQCLLLGDDFDIALKRALSRSRVSVVLVSENTDAAYYQREEIALAVRRARSDPAKHRVVPLFLDASKREGDEVYGLTLKHGIMLSGQVDLAVAADRLLELLVRLGVEIRDQPQEPAEERDSNPVKVLFLAADPQGFLAIEEEITLVRQALSGAPYRASIDLVVVTDVTVTRLHHAMLEHRPEVVHFAGLVSKEEVLLCDPTRGVHACPVAMLAELFNLMGDRLRLAVMNACDTAGLALDLTSSVPCAIGVDGPIVDDAAVQFSAAFYRSLAFGQTIRAAFDQASIVLRLQGWGANAPTAVHEDLRLVGKATVARHIMVVEPSTLRSETNVPQLFWRLGMDPDELRLVGDDA